MYTFAGIKRIFDDDGNIVKQRFLASTKEEGKLAVWIDPPCEVYHIFIKLPNPMTKLQAAEFCLKHPKFKNTEYQEFLVEYIGKQKKKETKNEQKRNREEGINSLREVSNKFEDA
ncbi:MAG TPA: hypothetical protein VEP90_10270 [Methylomirabilota bacterium]|nr:hypothetical protein [Methylomirabilota bacterium]